MRSIKCINLRYFRVRWWWCFRGCCPDWVIFRREFVRDTFFNLKYSVLTFARGHFTTACDVTDTTSRDFDWQLMLRDTRQSSSVISLVAQLFVDVSFSAQTLNWCSVPCRSICTCVLQICQFLSCTNSDISSTVRYFHNVYRLYTDCVCQTTQ